MSVLAVATVIGTSLASAQLLYWDANGVMAGAGSVPTGTWGISDFWNTDSAGGAGTFSTITTSADDLFFVAGPSTTSGNSAYTVTVDETQAANRLTLQSSGALTLSGGTINLGAGGITGAQFAYGSTNRGAVTISSDIALQASSTFANNAVLGATNQINITGLIGGGHGITEYHSGPPSGSVQGTQSA